MNREKHGTNRNDPAHEPLPTPPDSLAHPRRALQRMTAVRDLLIGVGVDYAHLAVGVFHAQLLPAFRVRGKLRARAEKMAVGVNLQRHSRLACLTALVELVAEDEDEISQCRAVLNRFGIMVAIRLPIRSRCVAAGLCSPS